MGGNWEELGGMGDHEVTENQRRIARTSFVSGLDVSTSSHGVVGTARPICSSTPQPSATEEDCRSGTPIPARMRAVPAPGTLENRRERRAVRRPAQGRAGPLRGGHEHRRGAGAAPLGHERNSPAPPPPPPLQHPAGPLPPAPAPAEGGRPRGGAAPRLDLPLPATPRSLD